VTELLEVGRVLRAHGLRGDVVVDLVTTRQERLAGGAVLHTAATGAGTVEVEHSSPHSGHWIVHFRGHDTRESAEALRGAVLFAEPIEDPHQLWVHRLIGAEVVDQHGVARGRCSEVHAGTVSDLLVLDSGALVPVAFVRRQDGDRILVDAPDGLFDL
jgi:16S rRNA processing protein RimM